MVQHGHRRQLHAVQKLKYIHSDEHLRDDNQDIAQRHDRALDIGRVEGGIAKSDIDERVRRHDQDDDLGGPGNVVIDEPATVDLSQVCVDAAVEAFDEEALKDIVSDQEEDNEDNGDDECGKGGEDGDGFAGESF